MKVLVISPFDILQTQMGFTSRVYNLTKRLAKHEEVFFLFADLERERQKNIDNPERDPSGIALFPVPVTARWMQLFSPALLVKGRRLIKDHRIDLILAESHWAGLHALILHIMTGLPYIMNEQNAEYIRWRRMGKRDWRLIKIFEHLCCKYSKKIFCVSAEDMAFLTELGIEKEKFAIVPNGVDLETFKPDPAARKKIHSELGLSEEIPLILFSGSLAYPPNFQAVKVIYDTLLGKILEAVPDARFIITGSNPPMQFSHPAIRFTGIVDRIEDYINASDIVIAPLQSGGGTKLKIIEALACGKKVITTPIGAEGIDGEGLEEALVIAGDWEIFADKMRTALGDPNPEIPERFLATYSWDTIGEEYRRTVLRTLEERVA